MKPKISEFLGYFVPHAVKTEGAAPAKPPAHQFGYVFGSNGQTADKAFLQRMSGAQSNPSAYLARSLKWEGRRVWDCNGLAEGYYRDKTGASIDTMARYNYATWCGRKSPAKADKTLAGMPQMPGVALFSGTSASNITHVGFLAEKTGAGPLDWLVLEARGVDYGVVLTKLQGRGWAWWGVMDKYFDYDLPQASAPPTAATEVIPGGAAVCTGGTVYIRAGAGTNHKAVGGAKKGEALTVLSESGGWCEVLTAAGVRGFMAGKYVKRV